MSAGPGMRDARVLARSLVWRVSVLYALRVCAAWAFATGALVLVWRVSSGLLPGSRVMATALGLLAVALASAGAYAWRRRPALPRLLAVLDCTNRGGGLACAKADGVSLNGWCVPDLSTPPRVSWRWQPAARLLGAAVVFLAGGALIPVPTAPVTALQRLQAGQAADALREQLAVLGEEDLVPPDELRNWKEQLRQIMENSEGQDPVRTWEALDYLDEAVAGKTAEALQQAQEWTAAMQQAEDVLSTLQVLNERRGMASVEQARALGLLAEQLRQAAAEAGMSLPPELHKALQEMLADAPAVTLTPEQLRRLAELLRQQREALQLSPEQLARLRLLSAEEMQKLLDHLGESSDCEGTAPAEIAAALCNLPGGSAAAEDLLAACAAAAPGSGGVSRGRGDAALAWSGNTQAAHEALTPQALPSTHRLDLERAQLQGVSFSAAVEKTEVAVSAGTLTANGGASRARTQTVLPRHRHAVETYFRRAR